MYRSVKHCHAPNSIAHCEGSRPTWRLTNEILVKPSLPYLSLKKLHLELTSAETAFATLLLKRKPDEKFELASRVPR